MATKKSAESSRLGKLIRKSSVDIRAYARSPEAKAQAERLRVRNGGEPTAEDLAAMPPWTDEEWAEAERFTIPKQSVTLRLDSDIVAWLKEGGPRYQTRANGYLRSVMKAARRKQA